MTSKIKMERNKRVELLQMNKDRIKWTILSMRGFM